MIRFFKSSTVYAAYLTKLYASRPGLEMESYETQYRHIMADRFGWSDKWRTYLEATGSFMVEEVILNWGPLQKAWAKEAGVRYAGENWMQAILQAQLEAFRPDVWFVHGYEIGPQERTQLRKAMPWLKWVVGWDGVVKNDAEFYAGADQVLVCHPDSVPYYVAHGFHCHHFRLGFEASVLREIDRRPPVHGLSFVGGLSLTDRGHNRRLEVLDEVSRALPVSYWLSADFRTHAYLRSCLSMALNGQARYAIERLTGFPAVKRLERLSHDALFGLEMYQALADSRLVLNVHIDSAGDRAANMRMYEATGVGACLLTDHKENLHEMFDVDTEIATFKSTAECVEKARYLLDNEEQRKRIAEAGQARTLHDHSLGASIAGYARELTQLPALAN